MKHQLCQAGHNLGALAKDCLLVLLDDAKVVDQNFVAHILLVLDLRLHLMILVLHRNFSFDHLVEFPVNALYVICRYSVSVKNAFVDDTNFSLYILAPLLVIHSHLSHHFVVFTHKVIGLCVLFDGCLA